MDWATRRAMLLGFKQPVFNKSDEGGSGEGEGEGTGEGSGDGSGEGEGEGSGDGVNIGGGLLDRGKSGDGEGEGTGDGTGTGEGEGAGDQGDGRPQGLADKFWDADKGEVRLDAMIKAHSDLEKAHGKLRRDKGGDVPESADQYFTDGLDLGDAAPNMVLDGPDDPGLKAWGEVCHKHGIGKELATDLAKNMMIMMNDHMPEIIDPDAEFEALGKNAEGQIEAVKVWTDGLARDGKLSQDDADVIADLAKTANGIRLLAKFREMRSASDP